MFAAQVNVGDTVAAVWDDGEYYVVTVLSINDGKVLVHRQDGSVPKLGEHGSKSEVPLENVHPFDKAQSFKVGDHVLSVVFPGDYFIAPAVITEVSGESYSIKLETNALRTVPRDRVIAQPVIPADEVEVKVTGPLKHPYKYRLKKPATIEQAFEKAGGWSGAGEMGIAAKSCSLSRYKDGELVHSRIGIHIDRRTGQITILDEAWKTYHLLDGDQITLPIVTL